MSGLKNWQSAFDRIRRRSPQGICQDLIVESPFAFDVAQDVSEVREFLGENWGGLGDETDYILTLPGRDVNLVRDIFIAAAKFYHIVECVRSHIARGAMTWAIVESYHASLVGARLASALYGILSYGVNGRTVVVDFRPEFGSPDEMKSFTRRFGTVDTPIRILRPITKQLQQSDVWSLIVRLCNITSCPPESEEDVRALRIAAGEKVSAFRNEILYDSVAWCWSDDFGPSVVTEEVKHERLNERGAPQSVTVQTIVQIFRFINPRVINLCESVGFQSTSLSSLVLRKGEAIDLLG